MNTLRIATRRSALALWQAEHIATALRGTHAQLTVEVLPMSTRGDEILDQPLARIGGKGLFTHELERAMLEGRADLAVHSLKDLPVILPEGMVLAAVTARADARDAFVSARFDTLDSLPDGARVGTSSLRRSAQLAHRYPQLRFVALRGNVNTRLRKLDDGDYDAIILAVAGLQRLGLGERVRSPIPEELSLPAIGQGVLALECRAEDPTTRGLLAALEHPDTRACIDAERMVNRLLDGGCHAPLAAYATNSEGRLSLRARVAAVDGSRLLEATAAGPAGEATDIGQRVATDLLDQGAADLLAAARKDHA